MVLRSETWLFSKTFFNLCQFLANKVSQFSTCQNIIAVLFTRRKTNWETMRMRRGGINTFQAEAKDWSTFSSSSHHRSSVLVSNVSCDVRDASRRVFFWSLIPFYHWNSLRISSKKNIERRLELLPCGDVEALISKHRSQVEINRCFLLFIMIGDSTEGDQLRKNRWAVRTCAFLRFLWRKEIGKKSWRFCFCEFWKKKKVKQKI